MLYLQGKICSSIGLDTLLSFPLKVLDWLILPADISGQNSVVFLELVSPPNFRC